MTAARQPTLARGAVIGAAAVALAAVTVLTVDYVRAQRAAPVDAAAIAALQVQVQGDASAAATLAALQDRVTRTRQARKRRDDVTAVVLIVAAAAFVAGAKWSLALHGRRPVRLPVNAIKLELAAPAGKGPGPDIHGPSPVGPAFSPDLTFIGHLVSTHGRGKEAAIPILQAIQAHYRYLPDEALRRVCELTEITPAQIAGTSSFYARFRRSPVGDHVVRVCHGTACHVSGARQITEELRRHLHIPTGADTDPSRRFTIDEVACLGCCSLAPVLMVDEHTAGRLTPSTAVAALAVVREPEVV